MAPQFIYTMKGLGKVHPPDHQVLKDIWLSFYPGAKIGVLGLNGAGKSSLLRIMAGEDTRFIGEAFPAEGTKIGFLPQEPRLDPALDVRGNVERGVAEVRALLERYDEINAKFAEDLSPDEMDKVLAEQGRVQDRIDQVGAWELDSKIEMAMDALRCPPGDADGRHAVGRRAAARRAVPAAAERPGPAAARRADQPSRRRVGRVARAPPRTTTPARSSRSRTIATSSTTSPAGFSSSIAGPASRGRATTRRGSIRSSSGSRSKRRPSRSASARCSASSNGSACRPARGRPRARRASPRTSSCSPPTRRRRPTRAEIYIAPGPRLGDVVVEARGLRKAYGDMLLMDDVNFTLPPGGIVGVIGPNGAGKTTLFRMIVGQEQPDAGTLRLGETVKIGYVDQSRELNADNTVWKEITGGEDELTLGKRTVASRAYCSWFNFKGADQQRKVGTLSGGERNRVHLAKLLQTGANLLLLDEPTNDLDVDTLRALEEALLDFAGLRRRDQPRPLVPRSHRHAHAGVRRRQPGGVVRRQLPGLRSRPQAPPRRRGGPAASDQVQEADEMSRSGSGPGLRAAGIVTATRDRCIRGLVDGSPEPGACACAR